MRDMQFRQEKGIKRREERREKERERERVQVSDISVTHTHTDIDTYRDMSLQSVYV